jgi:hypothetical protein
MILSELPVAYVETNWLIGLSSPHDRWHALATGLLEEHRKGSCEIRLPFIALLEAKSAVRSDGLQRNLVQVKEALGAASARGVTCLRKTVDALNDKDLNDYLVRDTFRIASDTVAVEGISVIGFNPDMLVIADQLRQTANFSARDMVDLMLLATIIQDRRLIEATRPAIVFSTNSHDFDPKKGKVDEAVYTRERLLFDPFFELGPAVGRWRAACR